MRRIEERWGRQLAAVLVAAVMMLCGGPMARAQDGGEGQGGFAGGGQMVRGVVTASSTDSLTLKTGSGETYKVTVTPNTRVMKARQPVKIAEIKAGDGVGAMGLLDAPNKTLHAMFVSVMDAEQLRKAEADLGKTYIAGQVTAIDEVKLTIKRPDGVVQVIEVDEGTSFKRGGRGMGMMMGGGDTATSGARTAREGESAVAAGRGGESITLADVKVGDSVVGRGGLKSGVFVPTELGVTDPSARRRRGGSANGSGARPGDAAGAPAPAPSVPQ